MCTTPRANMQEMMEIAQVDRPEVSWGTHRGVCQAERISRRRINRLWTRGWQSQTPPALHIEILEGDDPADTLLEFARSRGITQLFVGHSQRTGLARLRGSPLDKLIWEGHGMDVCVFPQ